MACKATVKGKEALPGEYINATTLAGQDVTMTIKKAYTAMLSFGGPKSLKMVVEFKERPRKYAFGTTVANQIVDATGIAAIEKWPGQKITLFPTKYANPRTKQYDPCIRVRCDENRNDQAIDWRDRDGEQPQEDGSDMQPDDTSTPAPDPPADDTPQDGAQGDETSEAVEGAAGASNGGPTWETLVSDLATQQECTMEAAHVRLGEFCGRLLGVKLQRLSPDQIADVASKIQHGSIKVNGSK